MEQEVAQKFWPLAELAREKETGGAAGEPGSGGELGGASSRKNQTFLQHKSSPGQSIAPL
jgi:hypothetical protein